MHAARVPNGLISPMEADHVHLSLLDKSGSSDATSVQGAVQSGFQLHRGRRPVEEQIGTRKRHIEAIRTLGAHLHWVGIMPHFEAATKLDV